MFPGEFGKRESSVLDRHFVEHLASEHQMGYIYGDEDVLDEEVSVEVVSDMSLDVDLGTHREGTSCSANLEKSGEDGRGG